MDKIAAARPGPAAAPDRAARIETLRRISTEFEAVFLAEMLKHAGVGRPTPGFDGGAGEAAFGSRLVAEQARLMAERGGLGVGEALFETMLARENLDAPAPETDRHDP